MSAWGNLDNLTAKGTVTTSNSSDLVNGFGGTEFTSNINAGDYVTIASNKYQVQNVVSNTQIYLTGVAATNSANVKMFVQQGPKYLSNAISDPSNVYGGYSIQRVFGVDRDEIANTFSKSNASHTGWTYQIAYRDANGVRFKHETLVAMSKNFNANANGNLQTDASDDTVLPQ